MSKREACILIVDDDRDVLSTANMVLKQHFSDVITLERPEGIPKLVKEGNVDVVLLDMNFSPGITTGWEGIHWLKEIRQLDPSVHVLMNTAYGDIKIAVRAMKHGAIDFIVKPWTREKLVASVKTTLDLKRSREKVSTLRAEKKVLHKDLEKGYTAFVAKSRAMKPIISTIEKVASTEAIVLILGENGTGKELIAREIHRKSKRKESQFVKVDLGAFPETLFESELFGHVKGAYTDAKESRPGRFEMASGGTLFLDEIGNLDVTMQAKLLTVLQSNIVTRIGSNTPTPVDVRIICATNKPIHQMVEEGKFRQDLLYRINTVEITLPLLKERMEDIPLLAFHFLDEFKTKYDKPGLRIGEEAIDKLCAYHWPGNIRELQHVIERTVIMCEQDILKPHDFLLQSRDKIGEADLHSGKIDDIEKAAIVRALNKGYKNMDKVAEEVGLSRSTLYRKMKKFGL
ncbi:MAG: AAA family ATPase [Bacteroides sp. SM23_62]|nr:MAG: AAA family ATPase [Bacteroides sp. SM23_62]